MKKTRQPDITATTTDVLGYFNGNSWPVNVSISVLGRTFALAPNAFITDDQGHRVNDPLFERYVGPMQLSREWVPSGAVPITRLTPVTLAPSVSTSPVHEASSFVRGKDGVIHPVLRLQPAQTPAGIAAAVMNTVERSPVIGMSIEEARRRKLVRPTIEPNTSAQPDTTGAPAHGALVEEIDYARDARPNSAKKLTVAEAASGLVVEGADAAGRRDLQSKMAAAQVEAAEPTRPESVIARAFRRVMPTAIVGRGAAPQAQASAPVPTPVPAPSPAASQPEVQISGPPEVTITPVLPPPAPPTQVSQLPPPDLEDEPESTSARPATVVDGTKRFVCKIDGKGFDFRSQLARYAKQKYAARFDEVMADYPPKPAKAVAVAVS